MRFTEEKFPVLKAISEKKSFSYSSNLDKTLIDKDFVDYNIHESKSYYLPKNTIKSNAFKSVCKSIDHFDSNNDMSFSGNIILNEFKTLNISSMSSGEFTEIHTHVLENEKIDISMRLLINNNDKSISIESRGVELSECDVIQSITLCCIKFIKYAPVETKIINSSKNRKIKVDKVKYCNETVNDIIILDMTWFTNIIKTDSFLVNGYWRMQPCGKENKDRKLTWVKAHTKKGMIIKARKSK